jgi:hypothetical protein
LVLVNAFAGLVPLEARFVVTFDPSWLDSMDVNAVPVQVVGWGHEDVWNYPNLAAARKAFPELDPYKSTTRFTAAMRGEVNNELALRFETWAAYQGYSP